MLQLVTIDVLWLNHLRNVFPKDFYIMTICRLMECNCNSEQICDAKTLQMWSINQDMWQTQLTAQSIKEQHHYYKISYYE